MGSKYIKSILTFLIVSVILNILLTMNLKGYYKKYQVDFEFPDLVKDGAEFKFKLKIYPNNPLLFTCYYWSKEIIEDAFYSAGFKSIEWISPKVSTYGKIVLGQEYWQPMIAPSPTIVYNQTHEYWPPNHQEER